MDANGSNESRVTYDDGPDREPALSPDGSIVAFRSNRGGSDEIYIIGSNRSGLSQLTSNSAYDGEPAWSPNGRRIAFVSDRDGNDEIYLMNADGTGQTRLTQSPGADRDPAWSPDGRRIAFISDREGSPEVYVMSIDGSQVTRLTRNGLNDAEPAWSPDGSKIAFSSIRPPSSQYRAMWEIFVMNADGSNQLEVPDDGAYAHRQHPSWLADGSKIVFADGRIGAVEIYSVNPDGSSPIRLTTGGGNTEPTVQPPRMKAHPVGLVDSSKGLWHLFDANGDEAASFYYGNPGDYPFVGDWNCNGTETPGLYRQSDGYAYLRNSNTQGIADIRFFFGNPGDVPIAGDFNGDGCGTLSIYRPSNQTFYIINKLGENDGGLGAADFSYVFGNPGDKPFVGDFNGDGFETAGLHRESTGLVYFRNSHTQGNADAQFIFGDPGDRLIAGDWNNDGKFSPALFRGSNTTFYFRYTNTQGNADAQFVPMPSDGAWLPVAGTR